MNPFLFLTFFAPLFAALVGAWIAHSHGISYFVFLPNLAAIIIGAPLVFLSKKINTSLPKQLNFVSWFSIALIGASLLFPGMDGVHRWLAIGPFNLNASMALLPLILLTVIFSTGMTPLLNIMALCLIHFFQPDAGQALAFAFAGIIIFALDNTRSLTIRWVNSLLLIGSAFLTFFRPDHLSAVEHVEKILRLAYSQGALPIIATSIALLLLLSPFAWAFIKGTDSKMRVLSLSYFVLFLISFAVTKVGNFPVPLIGAGAAPVIGWMLSMSLLYAMNRK